MYINTLNVILLACIVILILVLVLMNSRESFTDKRKFVWTDYIDAVLYINLENREDRKDLVLGEFKKLGIPDNIIHRIDAVYTPKNGHKGCVRSHIKALDKAKIHNWGRTLIIEDDFEIAETPDIFREQVANIFSAIKENNLEWDVIMFATAYAEDNKTAISGNPNIVRIKRATTGSAYVINQPYIDTLLKCFHYSDENMSEDKVNDLKNGLESYALDQQWFKLQEKDNWFGFKTDISKQRAIWSSTQTGVHETMRLLNAK